MRLFLALIPFSFLFLPNIGFAQGDNYVLFSKTGDTLLTRTSCTCKTEDTLTTSFNVLKNRNGTLQLVSVFQVREPGKNGIPCADFKLVSSDTITKYGLYYPGKLGTKPKRFKIKSKVLAIDSAAADKGKFIYRQIRHTFKVGWNKFYTTTVWTVAKAKNDKIDKPKIHKVYGSKELKKYHFIAIIVSARIDGATGKLMTTYAHTSLIN